MFSRRKQKKKIKKALRDNQLQEALEKASSQHFQKYYQTKQQIPWEEYRKKAQAIREECLPRLAQLIQKFTEEARHSGAQVYAASNPEQALSLIEKILRQKKAKLIVKSKSMVSEEINLNRFLEQKSYQVVETDLGERIIQLAQERPSHITAPALHKTKQEIAELFTQHYQKKVPPDSKEIVQLFRQEMRDFFIKADVGISGANLAVAESGTVIIISNEGNARLVTSLPPVHIVLLTTEKFVETLEQAATLMKTLIPASSGFKMTAYVSLITGPSRTTDIEKELISGVHGPQEVHIIILDNGRLKISKDKDLSPILHCLKCGGCMLVCPVFQSVGGHVYGGPVYPGGIGALLTAVTHSLSKASSLFDLCADCKKCQEFCPLKIPTSNLILHFKNKWGSKLGEKGLSTLFTQKSIMDVSSKILSLLQKPWRKNGYLKSLPFSWAKRKSFPALNIKKFPPLEQENREKIYFFQGCLVKQFFPEVTESVFTSLSLTGFNVLSPPEQYCCGVPSLHLGDKKAVLKLAQKNWESIKITNPDYILTVCPTGNALLKNTYPQILPEFSSWAPKIFDFTEFLNTRVHLPFSESSFPPKKVFYHHPCHCVNELNLRKEPLQLLSKLGYSPVEEEPLTCCGFCGVFSFKNPEISEQIWRKKKKKILSTKISVMATDCPGCLLQLKSSLKKENPSFQVYHTAELVAEALSKRKIPSHPRVKKNKKVQKRGTVGKIF